MTRIPAFRLSPDPDVEAAVLTALRSGQIATGPDVQLFEQELARFVQVPSAVALSSGFASLHLALVALGIGERDEVIIPCVSTCAAIRDAVSAAGGSPVFADTNADDFNLDPDDVRRRITSRTRAIIAPHHTGIPSHIEELGTFGIPVIEDCAQAIGATRNGKPVGSLSALSIFSFYATKLMTTIDGGAVAGTRPDLIERVRELRYYAGRWDQTPRFNYKMQNVGAALGRVELRKLPESLARRKATGESFESALSTAGLSPESILQRDPAGVYFRFAFRVRAEIRDEVIQGLERLGIPARVEVGFLTANRDAFPKAARLSAEVVSLPTYAALMDEEIQSIGDALIEVLRGHAAKGAPIC